jgi:hypothetical protein
MHTWSPVYIVGWMWFQTHAAQAGESEGEHILRRTWAWGTYLSMLRMEWEDLSILKVPLRVVLSFLMLIMSDQVER